MPRFGPFRIHRWGASMWHALFESAADALMVVDASGRIVLVNAKAEELFGYARGELVGDVVETLVPERLRDLHASHREASADPRPRPMRDPLVARRKDGTTFPAEVSLGPPDREHGSHVIAIVRDASRHVRCERELTLLKDLSLSLGGALGLHQALDVTVRSVCEATGWSLGEAWLPNAAGTELEPSPAWFAAETGLEGFRRVSLDQTFAPGIGIPGRVWESVAPLWLSDCSREPVTFLRATAAAEAGLRAAVGIPVHGDGHVVAVLDFFLREVREEDPAHVELISSVAAQLGTALLRREAADEVHKLNAELERRVAERTASLAAANEELEAFSHTVSHDLRAPLRAMDGFSRILMEEHGAELPGDASRYLAMVRDNARQMGELVDDLLAFSQLGRRELNRRPLSMNDVMGRALDALRPEMRGGKVDLEIADLPPAEGDPALLKQVFVNLISNALKFTSGRGRARIEVGALAGGQHPVYFVADNGVGFDMRYAHKLFGVFQRLHRAEDYPGTGVGLATVQRIVERHGGRVWAEAELDRGATFSFTLAGGTTG